MKMLFSFQCLEEIYKKEKTNLIYSLIFTLLIGGLAYGFMLANGYYSHDSLSAIYSHLDNQWETSLGRFFQPVFRRFFVGPLNTFWYQGFLGLFFISLSSILIFRLFNLSNRIYLFFISAILTLNLTSCLLISTYIQWFCIFSLAQLLSTIAVYIAFNSKKYWVLAAFFLFSAIGLYQLYLSNFLVLTIIKFIQILNKENNLSKSNFVKIISKLFVVTITGLILYAVTLLLLQKFGGLELANSYNSVNKAFTFDNKSLNLLLTVYLEPLAFLVNRTPYWNLPLVVFNVILYVASIILILVSTKGFYRFISFLLIILLPIASNVTVFLTGGMIHGLMLSPFFYCFFICCISTNSFLVNDRRDNRLLFCIFKIQNISLLIFLTFFTFNSIKFSNILIEKKHLESVQTFVNVNSFVNRLNAIPSYQRGITKVVIVTPESNIIYKTIFNKFEPFLNKFYLFTGNDCPSAVTYELTIRYYLNYFLNQNINLSQIIPLETFKYRNMFDKSDHIYLDNTIYLKIQ